MEEGKYIYCIIKENNPEPEQARFGARERNFGLGINGRQVNLLPSKDIAAVVSSTPVINFDRLDEKELRRYVAVHQKVNEAVMEETDVVPMTFGIIAPSINELFHILERAYLQFKTALKKIKGKVEFAVQVRFDQKKLLEELANTHPEIQKLHKQMVFKGDILGIPAKMKLGKMIQVKMETQRQGFIRDIHRSLNELAHNSTQNKLIDEDMIANLSFLVDREKEPELDRKMQQLGKKYEGKLRFKYIGPMPPYSFVNINLSLGNFELVNEARKILGLPEIATFEEIKKVYYKLAHQYHPDKFRGGEDQIKKIAKAYSILESYCQSCDELMGKGHSAELSRSLERPQYSFKEEDVKNSIIVR